MDNWNFRNDVTDENARWLRSRVRNYVISVHSFKAYARSATNGSDMARNIHEYALQLNFHFLNQQLHMRKSGATDILWV